MSPKRNLLTIVTKHSSANKSITSFRETDIGTQLRCIDKKKSDIHYLLQNVGEH